MRYTDQAAQRDQTNRLANNTAKRRCLRVRFNAMLGAPRKSLARETQGAKAKARSSNARVAGESEPIKVVSELLGRLISSSQ